MLAQIAIDNQALQEQFRSFLKEHLSDYIAEHVNVNEARLKELSIIERVVRVEEELKHLRVLEAERHEPLMKEMNVRFDFMNTRFDSLQKDTNTRFEAMQKEMNTRFEALERRFSSMQWLIASGIAIIALLTTLRPVIP